MPRGWSQLWVVPHASAARVPAPPVVAVSQPAFQPFRLYVAATGKVIVDVGGAVSTLMVLPVPGVSTLPAMSVVRERAVYEPSAG